MKQLYSDYSFFLKIIVGAIVYMLFFTSMADGQSVTGKWKAEAVTQVLVPQGQDPAKAEIVKQMLADLTITVGADKSFSSHTTQPMFLNISGANWIWDPSKALLAVVDNVIPGGEAATLMTWQITEISGNKAVFTFKDGEQDVLTVRMAKADVQ